MKLKIVAVIILINVANLFASPGYSQMAKVTLDMENKTLEQVMDEIERQSEFYFIFNQKHIDVERVITAQYNSKKIDEILDDLFAGTDIFYAVLDRKILLSADPLEEEKKVIELASEMLQNQIGGVITDSDTGEPMPGVNIQVKGTTIGVISGTDGSFRLPAVVDGNSTLIFSFIGYRSLEVEIGGRSALNVQLSPDITGLDEVVVIGYGTMKKSDVTGSLVSVDKDAIMATQPVTINRALQGKAAGVMIVGSDDPDATTRIRIRGNRSLSASNEPLYVVDGVPTVGTIDDINPADIESIEILKDASSTAIYGARGANGVILISTKKGGEGQATINYTGSVSVGTIYRNLELFDGAEYAEYVREAYRNSPSVINKYNSATPSWEEDQKNPRFASDSYVLESLQQAYDSNGNYDPAKVRSYDWRSLGLNQAAVQNQHTLSISGGTQNTRAFISSSINTNEGIMVGDRSNRYTIRANIDQKIKDLITIGTQSSFSHTYSTPGYRSLYTGASSMSPLANPYQEGEDAGFTEHPGGDPLLYNPVRVIGNYKQESESNQNFIILYASIDILKSLNFKTSYGLTFTNQNSGSFSGKAYTTALNSASSSESHNRNWTLENLLTYNKSFGVHTFTVNLLQSAQQNMSRSSQIRAEDMPYETQLWYDLGSASNKTVSSNYSQWNLMSYMGRIYYNFKEKYLFTGTLRYDGASRLAPGYKWVAFPSLALAWRINQEEFLKNNNFISNLKLRVGWGQTGNSAISPYQTLGTVRITRYGWNSNTEAIGYYPSAMSNTLLTWETTRQTNLGLDFAILKGKISGTIDLYRQNTTDLLNSRSLPTVSGFSSIVTNIGQTRNQGIDVSLNTVNVDSKDWTWTTDFTFSFNKEEIVDLGYIDGDDIGNRWFIGHPANIYYDYVFDGVWGTADQLEMDKFNENGAAFMLGDPKIKDLNGDYKIDGNNDRKILGQTYPKVNIGFSSSLQYKNWDLYAFAYGVLGGMTFYDIGVGYDGRYNSVKYDYWTFENQNTRYFRPQESRSDFSYENVSHYFNSDFIRISDITLGYNVPKITLNRFNIDKLRLYLKANRPFLITNFIGNDPEAGVGSDSYSLGGDSPVLRYFMFGVNLTF